MSIILRGMYDGKPEVQLTGRKKKLLEDFKKDIFESNFNYKLNKCMCGSTNERTLNEQDRLGLFYRYVICLDCGLIRANPVMDDKTTSFFYKNYYNDLYHCVDTVFNENSIEVMEKDFASGSNYTNKHLVPFLKLEKLKKITMIGCGSGAKLYPFHQKGINCIGIDYSKSKINFGKDKGLELYCGDYKEILPTKRKADLIILDGVMEHFVDLKREMKLMKNFITENGQILVGLPDALRAHKYHSGNICMEMMQCHNFWFSKESLISTMSLLDYEFITSDYLGPPHYLVALFKHFSDKNKSHRVIDKTLANRTIRYLKYAELFFKIRKKLYLDLIKRKIFNKLSKKSPSTIPLQ